MERRKAEAQSYLHTLKQECEITTELLNKLILMCSKHVTDIGNLDTKSFRMYSKYFLDVLQFQSESIRKITEWNFDLEEFLSEKEPFDLQEFTFVSSTKTSISSPDCETKSICSFPSSAVPYLKTGIVLNKTNQIESNIEQNTNLSIGDKVKNCIERPASDDVCSKLLPINNSVDDKEINCNQKYILDKGKIPEQNIDKGASDQDVKVEEPILNKECLTGLNEKVLQFKYNDDDSLNESLETDLSVQTIVSNNNFETHKLDESISSSEHFYSASSFNGGKFDSEDVSSYADFYSDLEDTGMKESKTTLEYFDSVSNFKNNHKLSPKKHNSDLKEKPKQGPSSHISDKLKTLPTLSLKERFLESLPKPVMPDIALRPVSQIQASKQQSDNPVSSLTLENINKAFGTNHEKLTVKTKTLKEFQEFKNDETLLGIPQRRAPKVDDICMIGYVQSPSELYIQVADENIDSLDVLSMQLSEIFNNSPFMFTSKTVAMRKRDNFWILNQNESMYRVEVLDWLLMEQSDEVQVDLVDYGGKYRVSFKNLRPLDVNLRDIPRMAQLCHLAHLYPPESTKSRRLNTWPDEVIHRFFEVLGDLDNSYFRIAHVYYCNIRKSYEIDLINIEETYEENTIGQILLDNGLAREIFDGNSEIQNNVTKDQILRAQGLNGITQDMPRDDILEKYFQENEVEEAETLNEAIMRYNPRDEAETCKNLRRDGTCFKGNSCKLRHIPLTHAFTSDKEPVYDKAFQEDPLPSPDDEIFVIISHVEDVQCFYAQIKDDDNNFNGNYRPTLNNLIKRMNDPDVVRSYEKLKLPPICGQLVIAKHWNRYWYRGQVMEVHIPENSRNVLVEVFIVDFGDRLEVPMSDLRVITADLLNISFQAIECRLYNVKHKNGISPNEEKSQFEGQYLGRPLKAKIVAVSGHMEILLEDENGEDIGLKLIEDGVGELNTEHIFPADDERILID